MLKNFRLIATVLVFTASSFGAFAQTNETDNYKDVLLNGKPAKLNLITGEVTYANGEIAKSRAAKKIKDSLLDSRTEIKTNLIKDMETISETEVVSNANQTVVEEVEPLNTIESVSENNNSKHLTDDDVLEETPSLVKSTSKKEEVIEATTSNFHLVKEGENLYAISKRYNTTLNELIIANKLETTLIKPGQNLRVRNFDFSEAEITWIVSRGDTLYSIAKKNNTTVDELKTLNQLSGNLIKVGQKLQVNQNSTLTKK
ncbi:LysM peptidoglycan-binding domain-containing protein [Psychroserpens sp. S379A]|uniref:LysM peptidoglycan-binding domain-containing protein n=1 Tax=Psychroserpens sp. S379A TaxID=3415137 RepID=UPI003C798CA6